MRRSQFRIKLRHLQNIVNRQPDVFSSSHRRTALVFHDRTWSTHPSLICKLNGVDSKLLGTGPQGPPKLVQTCNFLPRPKKSHPQTTRPAPSIKLYMSPVMSKQRRMSSPIKKQPELVADRVLKRVEISKVWLASTAPVPTSLVRPSLVTNRRYLHMEFRWPEGCRIGWRWRNSRRNMASKTSHSTASSPNSKSRCATRECPMAMFCQTHHRVPPTFLTPREP